MLLSDCSGGQTQPCSLQPLKEAISVLFSFTRRVLDDTQFQTDIHHWLERLVYTHTPSPHIPVFHVVVFSNVVLVPLYRWRCCCMSEDLENTCTCCAICCAVLPGWASGLHLSCRLDMVLHYSALSEELQYILDGSFFVVVCLRSRFWGTPVECSISCKLWPSSCLLQSKYLFFHTSCNLQSSSISLRL